MNLFELFSEFFNNPTPDLFIKVWFTSLSLFILFRLLLGFICYLIEFLKK